MDRMKSAKAIELEKSIDILRQQIKYWKDATGINQIQLKSNAGYPNVNVDYVSLKALRAITVVTIEEKLEKLEAEYIAL